MYLITGFESSNLFREGETNDFSKPLLLEC